MAAQTVTCGTFLADPARERISKRAPGGKELPQARPRRQKGLCPAARAGGGAWPDE
jgi:hypothetical protein